MISASTRTLRSFLFSSHAKNSHPFLFPPPARYPAQARKKYAKQERRALLRLLLTPTQTTGSITKNVLKLRILANER